MERTSIETAPASPFREGKRLLSEALGSTDVAVNHYDVAPGGVLSSSLHTHYDQEEIFVVESGTATFWTGEEVIDVGAGEAIRFAPGEFHHGYNAGDGHAVVIGIGAPAARHDFTQIESRVICSACGERTSHDVEASDGGDRLELRCRECGTENDPPRGDDPPPDVRRESSGNG